MRTSMLLRAGALMLLLAACGEIDARTTPADGGDALWGRVFLSTSVTEDGQPRPLVEGTQIRISFTEDHRLVATTGCNTMGGAAEVDGDRLVVSDLATTEMGCDPPRHEQDEWLGNFLSARPRFQLDDADLNLLGGTTEIRLQDREVADPDRPLRGTRWVVDTIVDGDAASSVPPDADAHITLEEDADRFGGSTGCNQMGGTATVADGSINFAEVISTKMACSPERMDVEESVLAVLDGDVAYEIEADVLRLSHPNGKGLHLRATS